MKRVRMRARLALIGAVAAGIAGSAGAAVAQVGTPTAGEPRTIRVSGIGEVQAEPDLATVQFAVETTGETAQEAAQANADLMDAVIGALVAAGVSRDDISTTGYSLFPVYADAPRGSNEEPMIRGYRAHNQVGVETENLEGIGVLIDTGLAAGANRLSGVVFELRESDAAEAEALEQAVLDARAAAETIATTLGVQLGQVLDASTSSEPVRPFPSPVARDVMGMAEMRASTPIEPGEQTVRATASLVFEIQ